MWKMPNRPNKQISQTFTDGIASICKVEDVAEVGKAPKPHITEVKYKLRYEEKRVGVTRFYSARQAQIVIDKVIRVLRVPDINTNDIVVLSTGQKYRIDQVQKVEDVYPDCMDISLILYDRGDIDGMV